MIRTIGILLFVLPALSYGWEVDNFHCRYYKLSDTDPKLDQEVNRRIQKTLKKFNRGSHQCDKKGVLSALRGSIAPAWSGSMEEWAQDNVSPKCLNKNQTVYDGFGLLDAPVLRAAGLNYVIQVNGVKIGADKLSHFMTEGYDYYMEHLDSGSIKKVLDIGKKEEEGSYGWSATGVKSYGDLTANYHGFLFWKNMVEGDNPYLVCKDGKWVQSRDFKWSDYVNPLFDESINCSEFKTEKMNKIVDGNVADLQRSKNKKPLVCPLNIKLCSNVSSIIQDKYVREQIVHPRCIDPTSVPAVYSRKKNKFRRARRGPPRDNQSIEGDANAID